jgi:hypothetical protein
LSDAAKESNLPSRGLPGPASFEDWMGHQARAAPALMLRRDVRLASTSRLVAPNPRRRPLRHDTRLYCPLAYEVQPVEMEKMLVLATFWLATVNSTSNAPGSVFGAW